MTRIASILILFTFITVNQVVGQIVVSKVQGSLSEVREDGFFYSLPRTGINIDVLVKKSQKIKGPYSEFADKYLGLTQVISMNSTEYEVAAIRLSTFTEPDPDNFYFARNTGKKKDRQTLEFFLSENGALVGMGDFNKDANHRQAKELGSSGLNIPEIPNPTMFERVDTVIRRISVDTTTIEQKVFKKISSAKTPEQKAKEAADFILKLDESMFNLINGYQEVNYEKGTMEFMYKQMDELKNEYLELFKGVTNYTTETYSFRIVPAYSAEDQTYPLCKFSIGKGVMDKNLSSGDLLQLEISNLNKLGNVRSSIEQHGIDSKSPKGIYYRIPDEAMVKVKLGGQVKIESQFTLDQFGVVTFLPAKSLGNLELYNNTGGLRHVIVR
ncbi:MAG: DUF4831 family protein [Bacteroidetes bacterium]|nr:DUF4831 family protein [Bacteroidota bacterium]